MAKGSINDKEFSKVAKIEVKKNERKMGCHAWNSGENNIPLFHQGENDQEHLLLLKQI